MAAIVHDSFKLKILKLFTDSLATNSLYLGIGRSYSWGLGGVDSPVPAPENNTKGISSDWEDLMSLKKIISTDIYHGIQKETWKSGVKYDAYRHDWDGTRTTVYNGDSQSVPYPFGISDVKCTVVTANSQIYMCIKPMVDIDSGETQPSLYSPESGIAVGTNTGIVKCADGYYWKFIAVTSSADLVKFSTRYHHPIETIPTAVAPANPYYSQWISQENSKAFKGGIYVINVIDKGLGYNGGIAGTRAVVDAETDAEFKVIGDGIGLQCTVIYGSGGTIEDIEITNPGTGYTHAVIQATTSDAPGSFEIIYTPQYGLGVDPVRDVAARYMLINTILDDAEGGKFTIENEYRKIALIYNPTIFGGSGTIATAPILDATITLNLLDANSNIPPVGAYLVDDVVTGSVSNCIAKVVDYDETTGKLRIVRTETENSGSLYANNSFQVGDSLSATLGTGGGVLPGIIQSIGDPDVQKFSGDIIYSEYRAPILRSSNQSESINIVIKM